MSFSIAVVKAIITAFGLALLDIGKPFLNSVVGRQLAFNELIIMYIIVLIITWTVTSIIVRFIKRTDQPT